MASFDINFWFGFLFVGATLAILLYGVSCAQTLYYFRSYPEDPLRMKSFIALLWALDTARAGTDIACVFWIAKTHGQAALLPTVPPAFAAEFGFSKFVILGVQGYFIDSIWKLLGDNRARYPLTLLGVAITLLGLGCGLRQVVSMATTASAAKAILEDLVAGPLGLAAAVITDVYITVCLCIILGGRKTGFQRTETLITKMISFSATRGIFTALFQLVSCVLYSISIHSEALPWTLTLLPATSVYMNSLLATLNIRHHLKNTRQEAMERDVPMRSFHFNSEESSVPQPPAQKC